MDVNSKKRDGTKSALYEKDVALPGRYRTDFRKISAGRKAENPDYRVGDQQPANHNQYRVLLSSARGMTTNKKLILPRAGYGENFPMLTHGRQFQVACCKGG